jgi:hypothetical protein
MNNTKYLIYGLGRSGTSTLASSLSSGELTQSCVQEPYILSSGSYIDFEILESFKSKFVKAVSPNNPHEVVFLDQASIYHSLDFLYENFSGVKHVYSSSNTFLNFHIINYCRSRNIKIVNQFRFDLLKCSLSNWLIDQTKLSGYNQDSQKKIENFTFKPIPIKKVRNLAFYLKFKTLEANSIINSSLISSEIKVKYELLYSSDIKLRRRTFSDICSFLNIDSELLDSEILNNGIFKNNIQYNKESIYEKIPNYIDFLNLCKTYKDVLAN